MQQPSFDRVVLDYLKRQIELIEGALASDVIYYYGPIDFGLHEHIDRAIVSLQAQNTQFDNLAIVLTTQGGSAEVVERCVKVLRYRYPGQIYFLIPDAAMSAGTLFCMSGDKIYMDHKSALGPIDPQVLVDGKYVPANGYLDKIKEVKELSRTGNLAPFELEMVLRLNLADVRYYEQARDLSRKLLKDFLIKYKFKNWNTHKGTFSPEKRDAIVTIEEKELRAEEIAVALGDNNRWSSHGRYIQIRDLTEDLKLQIEDFGDPQNLLIGEPLRNYHDVLSDYLRRHNTPAYIHTKLN
jgi:hypothetical protein